MISREFSYTGWDGVPVEGEVWTFNINKADALELAMAHDGDLAAYLQEIIDDKDGGRIITNFKKMIKVSVGKLDKSGKHFFKTEELTNDFMHTPAYEEFLLLLVTDAVFAANWVNAIMPTGSPLVTTEPMPKEYAMVDLLAMTDAEFDKAVGTDFRNMPKIHAQAAFQRKWSHGTAA